MSGAPRAADAIDGPEAALPLAALPLPASAGPRHALAVDTTSDVLSLALLCGGQVAAAQYDAIGRSTTQEILPRIAGMLSDAGLVPGDLELLVVARGPGSFTGTRIGMAVALTFAQTLQRPLEGVDTLRLLAAQTAPSPGDGFSVLLNCARDEVYHARYRWSGDGLARESGIALCDLATLLPTLDGSPLVLRRFRPGVGTTDGVETAFATLPLRPLQHAHPDGTLLLRVGLGAYRARGGQVGARVEPIYLKSEAFRTWRGAP